MVDGKASPSDAPTLTQREREFDALLEISRAISSTLEFSPLLNLVLERTADVLPYDRMTIMLRDGEDLHIRAVRAVEGAALGDVLRNEVGLAIPIAATPRLFAATRDGEPLRIDDVAGNSPMAVAYREEVGPFIGDSVNRIATWMGIPIMLKGDVIGMMTLSADVKSTYTTHHASLARAIAAQVAVAVDNARLFAREAQRSRELSTLLEVSLNAAASIELEPLLNLVLGELQGVIPHDRVSIQTYENGYLTVLAARDASPAGAKAVRRDGYQVQVPDRFFATQFPDGMPAIVDDILDQSDLAKEYRATAHPHINSGLIPHGSYMAIPLMSRENLVGLLTMMRDQPGFYTADHARLGRAIGSQIAIAVDRARLFEETRRSARETEALLRADAELFRSLELNTVLQALVDVAVDVLGVDKSIVVLHEGDIDVVRATRNYDPANIAQFNRQLAARPHEEPPPGGEAPREYVDAAEAPDFIAEALLQESIASHISVPVRDTERMLGVFGVSFLQRHVFTDGERRLYTALADRAAVAIQNAELYEKAQHAASLEERQRLARELHDSVSQALYGIALGTRTARLRIDENPSTAVEPIEYVAALAEAGLAEMRALIFELRPESLETEGLVAAIEKQIASTRARHQLAIDTELMEEPDCRIDIKEALYRITQEALQNVIKHASATRATVELVRNDGALRLIVTDDGRGFDPSLEFPGHIGLHSMPERAAKLGGSVIVESNLGTGTRVVAEIPT